MRISSSHCISIVLLLGIFIHESFGTAGFAEWRIPTPLGNEINHTDSFLGSHGIALIDASKSFPLVSHLKTWIYYPSFIVGKAKKGFFVFNETTKEVEFFETLESQVKHLEKLGVSNPISRPYDNQKGWLEEWTKLRNPAIKTWRDFVRQSEEVFEKVNTSADEKTKELIRKSNKNRLMTHKKFMTEEYDFFDSLKGKLSTFPELMQLADSQREQIHEYIADRLAETRYGAI